MKYLIRFLDESLAKAVQNHVTFYETVDEAIEDAANIEKPGNPFMVLDENFSMVYFGSTGDNFR